MGGSIFDMRVGQLKINIPIVQGQFSQLIASLAAIEKQNPGTKVPGFAAFMQNERLSPLLQICWLLHDDQPILIGISWWVAQ